MTTKYKPSIAVQQYLRKIGSKGGKKKGPTKARTSDVARRAALKRWQNSKRGAK